MRTFLFTLLAALFLSSPAAAVGEWWSMIAGDNAGTDVTGTGMEVTGLSPNGKRWAYYVVAEDALVDSKALSVGGCNSVTLTLWPAGGTATTRALAMTTTDVNKVESLEIHVDTDGAGGVNDTLMAATAGEANTAQAAIIYDIHAAYIWINMESSEGQVASTDQAAIFTAVCR